MTVFDKVHLVCTGRRARSRARKAAYFGFQGRGLGGIALGRNGAGGQKDQSGLSMHVVLMSEEGPLVTSEDFARQRWLALRDWLMAPSTRSGFTSILYGIERLACRYAESVIGMSVIEMDGRKQCRASISTAQLSYCNLIWCDQVHTVHRPIFRISGAQSICQVEDAYAGSSERRLSIAEVVDHLGHTPTSERKYLRSLHWISPPKRAIWLLATPTWKLGWLSLVLLWGLNGQMRLQ